MRAIDENKNHPSCPGWRVECLFEPGAKLDQSLRMINEWKIVRHPEKPRMIVFVSFLCDVMEMVSLPGGMKSLKIRDSVTEGQVYPALCGLKDKILGVERSLKRHWRELDIIWVNPYVVDVRRWSTRKVQGDGSLSEKEIAELHRVSYQGARYFEEANKIGSRIPGMGDRFYPWFLAWNDKYKKELNYEIFMKNMPGQTKFGWINYRRTTDGLHPTAGLARQLVNMLYRKAVLCVPPPESLVVPAIDRRVRSSGLNEKPGSSGSEKVDNLEEEIKCNNEKEGVDEVEKLIKKLSVVERLILSPPVPSKMNSDRSNDLGKMGEGCCVGHGRVSSGSDYVKVSFPCGHNLPFDLFKDEKCSPFIECPVCEKKWDDLRLKCTSFKFLEFSEG